MALIEVDDLFLADIEMLKKEDRKLPAKVWELIADILKNVRHPLSGIGKPELLKGDLSGFYSRRVTDKHRLIYKITDMRLHLLSCYGHYDDK